jgi:hypothetical protein
VTLFCGIDWAESHHDVAIIDGDGELVARNASPTTLPGSPSSSKCSLLPAIAPRPRFRWRSRRHADCWSHHCGRRGDRCMPINPLAVARYRERHSVARAKSDHADAMTLGHILRVDAHLHRRLSADSELCQAIATLTCLRPASR